MGLIISGYYIDTVVNFSDHNTANEKMHQHMGPFY